MRKINERIIKMESGEKVMEKNGRLINIVRSRRNTISPEEEAKIEYKTIKIN